MDKKLFANNSLIKGFIGQLTPLKSDSLKVSNQNSFKAK